MTDPNQESSQVNISDINADEVNTGPIVTGSVGGDVVAGDKVGRDKITVGQQVVNFFTGTTEQQRDLRNRQAMLTLVHNTWVKGVLESSLHNEVLIELDLEERKSSFFVAPKWTKLTGILETCQILSPYLELLGFPKYL